MYAWSHKKQRRSTLIRKEELLDLCVSLIPHQSCPPLADKIGVQIGGGHVRAPSRGTVKTRLCNLRATISSYLTSRVDSMFLGFKYPDSFTCNWYPTFPSLTSVGKNGQYIDRTKLERIHIQSCRQRQLYYNQLQSFTSDITRFASQTHLPIVVQRRWLFCGIGR